MKKKNITTYYKYIVAPIALLIIALISWLLWPKSYEEMIPAQSKAVIRIDGKLIEQQATASNSDILKTLSKASEGIDFSKPIYGIVTPNEYVCVIAKVKNEDAIKDILSNFERKEVTIDDYDSRHWAWLQDGWLASWDGKSFLCAGPGVAQERDVLRQTISSMINTDDKFVNTTAFKRLKSTSSAIQIYAQLDAMPAPYNMLFRFSIPADCDPAAVQIFASTDLKVEKGQFSISSLNCDITSDNNDIVSAITQLEKQKGCIELATTSAKDSTLFRLATCTQGKPLLQLFKTDATLRGLLMGLNQTFDADQMLNSTDGLFSIEIGSFAKDWTPAFCIKAETLNKNLFADAPYWIESAKKQRNVTLTRNSANDFFLNSEKQQLHFGLNTNHKFLYFASPSMLQAVNEPIFVKRTTQKDGTLVYFHINTEALNKQPCMKEGQAAALIRKFLPLSSHSITYVAKIGRKATLTIE